MHFMGIRIHNNFNENLDDAGLMRVSCLEYNIAS